MIHICLKMRHSERCDENSMEEPRADDRKLERRPLKCCGLGVGGSSPDGTNGTNGRILDVFWDVKRVDMGHERRKEVKYLGPYSRNHCDGIT